MAHKLFINKKMSFPAKDENSLGGSIDFIENALSETGIPRKLVIRTMLLAEELIAELISHASEDASLRIQVRRSIGDTSVTIRAEGDRYDPFSFNMGEKALIDELEDAESQQAIRSILLKSQGDKIKISYKNKTNQVRILADQSNQQMLIRTVFALAIGIVFGLLMKFVFPAAIASGIGANVLTPARTIFMNALKIVIGPVIFFSIVSCISQFKDISELGRIGAKVMGMYLMTTVIAVFLALGIFTLLHPGEPGFALSLNGSSAAVSVDTNVQTSVLQMIVNIVPSNLFKPFLESDTLQIIFLAILCGIAVGMIGDYSSILKDLFEACNSLFLTITTLISRFIPLAVFCSVSLMTSNMSGSSLASVIGYTGTSLLTVFCMMIIYGLLILLLSGLNPITFFKKNREGMLTSLTLSSSSAAMPTNLRTCTDKLGISSKVCSFSIPLGATINMDGTCMFLVISGLFLARAYGIEVTVSTMISLSITIILLSLGCPGVPGAGLVCLGIVLSHLGVPIEAMGIIMAVTPILDMTNTMSNTTGDVAASLIVAKSEGLLDLETFNK